MSVEYKYKKGIIPGSKKYRPFADVGLNIENKIEIYQFLIDSGADRTIINYQLGALLGFSVKRNEKSIQIVGIGGFTHGYIRPIKLLISGRKINLKVTWIHSDKVPLLLGQDVFDYFKITFIKSKKKIIFVSENKY
ncbi:MAG: hypothetical protein FVQ77_09515 [Cytophagales bacterium]|nr:hypothetical protein [Cytophagales bacterium]